MIARKFWLTRAPKGDTGWLVTTQHEHYRRVMEWPVEGPFVPADQLRGTVDLLREARTFLDSRHAPDGKLARPANLIERIDTIVGDPRDG